MATVTRVEVAAVRIVGPSVLVKVWTDDLYGIGECYPSAPVGAIARIVRHLAEELVGEDARNVVKLAEKMRRAALFTGAQGGAVITAISGIEIAMWDLAGKLEGVSVSGLLGGRFRSSVRLYADCHAGTVDASGHHVSSANQDGSAPLVAVDTPEACAEAAKHAVSLGFTALKFDVDDIRNPSRHDVWNRSLSTNEIDAMVTKVGAIRDSIGRYVDLAIDMHGRYDVASAVRAARALEDFDLMWLEEPVPPESPAALAEVRRQTRIPICAGENLYTRFDFVAPLNTGAVDVVMPDVAKCGGLTEGRRIAEMAELAYVGFAPHNVSGPIGTIAAAHLCAAVSNFTVLEFHALDLSYWDDLALRDAPLVTDGTIALDDRPGLGVELDEDAAMAYRHDAEGVPFFG